jgi:hypothetical protein
MLKHPTLLAGILLWSFVLSTAVAQPAGEPTPMAQAVAAIKLKPKWQRIEIAEEKPTNYRLQLYYKPTGQPASPVIGQAEASTDTKEIARAVLAQLQKDGKDPARERIFVSVYAYQEGARGETGKALVRPFGSTVYDYNSDQLQFRPWKAR